MFVCLQGAFRPVESFLSHGKAFSGAGTFFDTLEMF